MRFGTDTPGGYALPARKQGVNMAKVTLTDVRKVYPGPVEAVRNLSLRIPDGSFFVLVGPSGCGKSTTLRLIAGLERATSGTIAIGDRVVDRVPPRERAVAMVSQDPALYPHLTVEKNLAFALHGRGVPKDAAARRVDEAMQRLGLEPLRARRPGALSGGQRQRVALGRAMVREPSVFLFDEPLSDLDAGLRVRMRREIRALQLSLRTTAVFVTHDQEEAMALGDMIAVMADGVIEQVGTPIEVYHNPANRFVASFIGSPAMNFVQGAFDSETCSFVGIDTDVRIVLTDAQAEALRARGVTKVVLGVRPSGLSLVSSDDEAEARASGRALDVVVCAVEVLGDETDLRVAAGGVELTARVEADTPVAPGESRLMAVDVGRVHLFEPGPSGSAIAFEEVPSAGVR